MGYFRAIQNGNITYVKDHTVYDSDGLTGATTQMKIPTGMRVTEKFGSGKSVILLIAPQDSRTPTMGLLFTSAGGGKFLNGFQQMNISGA
jgi:hypothetical protein